MSIELQLHDEKVPEVGSGDGCTTVCTYLPPLNCSHLKRVKMVNFMLCVFYHNKKKKKHKNCSRSESYRSRLLAATGSHAIVYTKSLNEMKPLNEMNKMT